MAEGPALQDWSSRRGRSGIFETEVQEKRFSAIPGCEPGVGPRFEIEGMFHTHAAVEGRVVGFQKQTFSGFRDWTEVGLSVLSAADWRPDVSLPRSTNLAKRVPRTRLRAKLLFNL